MGPTVSSQIFLQCMHFGSFYAYSIVTRPTPPHHQYGKCSKYCWCILTIRIYEMYLGVETMIQFLFLMLWQPISEWYFWVWRYDMLAKIHCLCSGGKNRVSMRDHDPWFIPCGYGRDDWVVFWCTMLLFLIQNLVIFVCETTAKRILFLNHRNRKDVGGKHNLLVHYVDVSAPNPFGIVVFCHPFK